MIPSGVMLRLREFRACLERESRYPHWNVGALAAALKWFDQQFPEVQISEADDGIAGEDQG